MTDLVSRLFTASIHHVLEKIFLSLSPASLSSSRCVCKTWYEYIHSVLWREKRTREKLLRRLDTLWREEKHRRVMVELQTGEAKHWTVDQGSLVMLHGKAEYTAVYWINDEKREVVHQWDRAQYQVRLSLNRDLSLETGAFLSKPVFNKQWKPRLKVTVRDHTIERDETEKTYLVVRRKDGLGEPKRVKPYTGWGQGKHIQHLSQCGGRLGLIVEGRVFVYSAPGIIQGEGQECLLLVATRQQQPSVEWIHLDRHRLLTAGGRTLVMFDFWTDQPSNSSEFFQ